jgi:hypothetical protein
MGQLLVDMAVLHRDYRSTPAGASRGGLLDIKRFAGAALLGRVCAKQTTAFARSGRVERCAVGPGLVHSGRAIKIKAVPASHCPALQTRHSSLGRFLPSWSCQVATGDSRAREACRQLTEFVSAHVDV